MARKKAPKPVVGWREWIAIPSLGVPAIKAKIDTGARSSSLHAFDMKVSEGHGGAVVSFSIHPMQKTTQPTVEAQMPLLEKRWVRSSSGHRTLRPVVMMPIQLHGMVFDIEVTLTRRDAMGFRMLLGRQALRKRFLVDPGKSYLAGRGPLSVRKRNESTASERHRKGTK
ncbi:MAG: ATP-dependent zinc protease [Phycisphaerae bacterium]